MSTWPTALSGLQAPSSCTVAPAVVQAGTLSQAKEGAAAGQLSGGGVGAVAAGTGGGATGEGGKMRTCVSRDSQCMA